MQPNELATTIQIIGIIATVSTLLGWTVRFLFKYFTKKLDERDAYMEKLVEQNQANVSSFVETINHNQTKMNLSVDALTQTMKDQTAVFQQLIKDDYGRRSYDKSNDRP